MNKLNLWMINHYAIPPNLAGGTRHFEFASKLADKGHHVTLWMSSFYHTGRFFLSPQMKLEAVSKLPDSLTLKWVWSVRYQANGILRILNMLSFALGLFLQGIFKPKPQLIMASTPHLFAALAGWGLSVVKRVPFVVEVRDLWPESLLAMGVLRKGLLFRALTFIEELLYRKSAKIIVLTEGIGRRLMERGIAEEKIVFVPNGVDLNSFKLTLTREELQREFGFENKFVIMYAGAHGEANGLEIMLGAAKLLSKRKEFLFVLVGEGPRKAALQAKAVQLKLENIRFLNPVTKEAMPNLLNAADILVAALQKTELFKDARPNKLFDYMAAGKPILCAIDGEARRLVESAGTGLFVEPGDPADLAEKVLEIYNDPEQMPLYEQRGKAYIRDFCDRAKMVLDLEEILTGIVKLGSAQFDRRELTCPKQK